MAKNLKVQVYVKENLLCEPLIDIIQVQTGAMLVFPDFNIFVRPGEIFTTKSGERYCQENLRAGFYVWVDWSKFQARDDACLHWNDQLERVPFEDEELDPQPPLAG